MRKHRPFPSREIDLSYEVARDAHRQKKEGFVALVASACAVIVAHNHPSGDPSPSQSDHSLTRRLAEAAELLQIKLLDHIIIGAPAEGRQSLF